MISSIMNTVLPIRILLVENNINDSIFFRKALNATRLKVDLKIASRSDNILNVIGAHPAKMPHLIFLDLHMPMVSSHKCLQSIRNASSLHSIPVVVYSSSENFSDIEDTISGGTTLHFVKPPGFQLLVNSLKNILNLDWRNYEKENSKLIFDYKIQRQDAA